MSKALNQLQNLKIQWLGQPCKDNRRCYKCGRVELTAGKSRARQMCFSCFLVSKVKFK